MSAEPGMARIFFREAIARALAEEMERDERLLVLGQDAGAFGGSYREFAGLHERFGASRVRDTPVAESGMVGIGVGRGRAGIPLACQHHLYGFPDDRPRPADQLCRQGPVQDGRQDHSAAGRKDHRGREGTGRGAFAMPEAWLMGVPGLTVLAPSTPAAAYGLLKSALRADGPVVFIDHKRLFPKSGEVGRDEHFLPIGKADIGRPGSDVSITSLGYMVTVARALRSGLPARACTPR
jgi:pyruvate/2-oxoglutarate/acetoin dehydrogenase E1 component